MEEKINSGFLLIDKPKNWTSFDVVAKLRNITGIRKIGHAGTLDPLATGLLIIAIGRDATKQIDKYVKQDKIYISKAKLGESSDTYDIEGDLKIQNSNVNSISNEKLQIVLKKFIGKIEQVPPMFSAKKINGKKLYELARQGKEIERKPAEIRIEYIKLLNYDNPWIDLEIKCSSGTYIRSLVHDIGQALDCGAVMYELRRLQIGDCNIDQVIDIKNLNKDNWQNFLK